MPVPTATLPNGISYDGTQYTGTVMDTSFIAPTGTTWACHSAADFSNALLHSLPNDIIVLDPGVVYSGNFVVPGKSQPPGSAPQWLHITTSGFHTQHPCGTRVNPTTDAADMAKVVSPNASQCLRFANGPHYASYVRVYGIEFHSASGYMPPGYTSATAKGYGYSLISFANQNFPFPTPMPDHIVFDRVYIHGEPNQDLQCGLQANFTYGALVDSYVSEIHMRGTDTQAFAAFYTNGPLKCVNNHLEAAGENVMFGGSGGAANPFVPSDIEIRGNHIYKPLSWMSLSTGTAPQMVVKNSVEFKSAKRVLLEGNIIENKWNAGQVGGSILLTVRTSQSGDIAVVQDVTITNNLLLNHAQGINVMEADYMCGGASYPNCKNAGDTDDVVITNNVVVLGSGANFDGHTAFLVTSCGTDIPHGNVHPPVKNILVQHNTLVHTATPAWNSIYFGVPSGWTAPFASPLTTNIWVLDNVLAAETSGDAGYSGQRGLDTYMPQPTDPPEVNNKARYTGNVMDSRGGTKHLWPPGNTVTTPITYVDAANGDYTLASPAWMQTTDGQLAGVDMTRLPGGGPAPPTNLQAFPQISWVYAGTGATFNLYRGTAAGAEDKTPYQTGLTATSYVDTNGTSGQTYYYTVTAVVSGKESKIGSEISATFG